MNVPHFILGRSKLVVFVVLVLAVLGVHSYLIAPQSIFPPMAFARVDVVADAGDLTPERVRTTVTRPLAIALGTLPAANRIRSTSTQGSSEIVVDFETSTDPRVDLQYVQATISTLKPTLPAATRIEAAIVNPNAEPVVSYGFASHALSQAALEMFLTSRIVPAFAGTPGLGRTSVVGGPPVEYRVELTSAALAGADLSVADVARAIADARNVQSAGTANQYHQHFVIVVDAAVHDVHTLAAIRIPLKSGGSVPLGSLGSVRLGVGAAVTQAAVNARHAVIFNAFGLAGADAVTLADAVESRLATVHNVLPADVRIVKYWDQTRLIVDSQTALRDAIFLGALLATVVIYLFLHSIRMTLIAAAIIPLALAIAVFALERTGQSLNLMSVGGLAVAVGLIIDDTIVVIEAIARGIGANPNASRRETIGNAVGTIAGPMVASTLTTLVVFIPLGLLSGVTGFFFRALALTLSAALIVSLGLAVGVAPIVASALLHSAQPRAQRADRLVRSYQPILGWALGHRLAVYLSAAVILTLTVGLLSQLPSDFLPKLDEGQFEIKYTLPPGATLADSDAAAGKMERAVLVDPDVRALGRLTGIDTNGFSPTQANTGTLRVSLKRAARASYDVISERLRNSLADSVPAATLDFHQLLEDQINDLSGAPQPIEIALTGPNPNTLIAYAEKVSDAVAKVPGVVDSFDGVVYDDPSIRITPRGAQLAALGMNAAELGDALSDRTQGTPAAQIASDDSTLGVNVRVAGAIGAWAGQIGATSLLTSGGSVALAALGRIDKPERASDVVEENGRRIERVTANIEGASLSTVITGLKSALARVAAPPGYSATIGGAYQTQQASFREFLTVLAIAVLLVFCVMLAMFGSLRLPLVILCAIPFALIGVAGALFCTRTPFNVSSFMGLLLLVGIVVKNGILLIDVANARRAAGDDVTTALVIAGSTRIRPIVMTTLAAIGGLLPLALGVGSGGEMERPLAIAVIGGLSTATAFTLVLIPVLYATLMNGSPRAKPAMRPALASVLVLFVFVPHTARAQQMADRTSTVATLRFAQLDLASAQQFALRSSPDVRVARATVDGAQAALTQARAANGLSFVTGYAQAPQGASAGTIVGRSTSYGVNLTLGDVAAYSALTDAARAALHSAQTDEIAAERTERIKLVSLYYSALKARAVRTARADAVASAQALLDAAGKRVAVGDAPRLDRIRATVALARARGDLAIGGAADDSATDALAREVGWPPSAFAATTPESGLADVPLPSPEAAVARALVERADIGSAESNVRASAAGVAAARSGIFPALTVGASYAHGMDSGFPIAGPILSAQLAIPVGGGIAARILAQFALLDAAKARRDAIARTVALEVGAAARTAGATVQAEGAATQALTAAKEEFDATTLGYRSGVSTSLDVSLSRATYVQAVVDALSARYDRLQAQTLLALDVGA